MLIDIIDERFVLEKTCLMLSARRASGENVNASYFIFSPVHDTATKGPHATCHMQTGPGPLQSGPTQDEMGPVPEGPLRMILGPSFGLFILFFRGPQIQPATRWSLSR